MTGMISPSLMCADFRELKRQIDELEKAGVEYLHCDIMDGIFVPNYSLGTDFVRIMHDMTDIPLDIHLMVDRPEHAIEMFDIRENDIVAFHCEACTHIQRTLKMVRDKGALAGIALNPATPLNVLEYIMDDLDMVLIMTVNPGFAGQKLVPSGIKKISDAKKLLDESGREIIIEVDGNVSFENAIKMRQAGADLFVAGTSSLFRDDMSIKEAAERLRECIL